MLTAQDILLQGAREEREKRENALIPVAVGSGMIGVAAGAPIDAVINRVRRMRSKEGQQLRTARGGRLAGSVVLGLAGALGVNAMPNRSAELMAKLAVGDNLSADEVAFIEQLAAGQVGRM